MTETEVSGALQDSEARLVAGGPVQLGPTGFWRAVGAVKLNPPWVERFADRIAAIDRAAFERWALLAVPVGVGTVVMALGTLASLVVISAGYFIDDPWNGLVMLAGMGIALVTTHGLGHLLVGWAVGIRFTHWFIGTAARPQPGVKIDYASYLRTPPRHRAWMHAAGAVVTKLIPFLVLGSALVAAVPWWATLLIVVVGVVQIITDVTLSVRQGDWKKYRREMEVARRLDAQGG